MIQLQIGVYETTVDAIWRIVIFIFKLLDSLMDSSPNYEEMFPETQFIILFSIIEQFSPVSTTHYSRYRNST
jgi:hypothetical protein